MLPACIVLKARGTDRQGPLLCRGLTTAEANTTYARAAEAAYGPAYASLAPAMTLDLTNGLQTRPETEDIRTATYRQVVAGVNPKGADKPVTVQALTSRDAGTCMGTKVTDLVPIYFDATDPKQGQGGAVYCLPANVHPTLDKPNAAVK
jgi:hypothetical protein